ncbi:MAG: FtsX-like permease family protein [Flavobacteriales bacterium]
MNLSFFLAKRLIGKSNHRYSRPVINIAIFAVCLSLSVMIISLGIINGFQKEIRDKIIGFDSHIQVTHISDDKSFEQNILPNQNQLKNKISKINGVTSVQKFATKAGLIKTEQEFLGIVLKGVDENYSFNSFFNKHLKDGNAPNIKSSNLCNEVIISKSIANKLSLNVNDTITTYFIQKPTRVRKFYISGIYDTGLSEFDDLYIIGDIKHIQRLNKWNKDECGGLQIKINSFDIINQLTNHINNEIGYDLETKNIVELNSQLFDWLRLQDINVIIIIVLMIMVALINVGTLLFIIILEKVQFIGTLKALGFSNWGIRKIFLYYSFYILSRGMVFGNLLGLGLLLTQKVFKIIKLDKETYYMSELPIFLDLENIFLLNIGTIIISIVVLILPTYLISKINPIKTIRFE